MIRLDLLRDVLRDERQVGVQSRGKAAINTHRHGLLTRTHVRYGVGVHLHEVESMRRSFAIGGSLTQGDAERLLDTCATLLAERVRIERILRDLGPAWGRSRRALNELAKVLRPSDDAGEL